MEIAALLGADARSRGRRPRPGGTGQSARWQRQHHRCRDRRARRRRRRRFVSALSACVRRRTATGAGAAAATAAGAVADGDAVGAPAASPAGDRAGAPGVPGSEFPRDDDGVTSVVPAGGSSAANGIRSADRSRAMGTAVGRATHDDRDHRGARRAPATARPRCEEQARDPAPPAPPAAESHHPAGGLVRVALRRGRCRRLLVHPLVRQRRLLRHLGQQPWSSTRAGPVGCCGSSRRSSTGRVSRPRRSPDQRLDGPWQGRRAHAVGRAWLRQQPAPGGDFPAAAHQRVGTLCREPGAERLDHGTAGDHHHAADDRYLRHDHHGSCSERAMRQQAFHDQGACMTTA